MSLVRTGLIGELKVQELLLAHDFNVYTNICDDGGVDLIIEKDNKYKKIQVKVSTKTSLNGGYKRYAFRLGNTGIKADFYICVMPHSIAIIPEENLGSVKAFFIYPDSLRNRSFSQRFLDRWDLLDK